MNLQQLLDNPAIRFKTKDILRIVDSMDVVDALKDIELIRAYLSAKQDNGTFIEYHLMKV